MISPFYWHPRILRLHNRFIYGNKFRERYEVISREIPDGYRVNDICAGDAYLYEVLKDRDIQYSAYDFNPQFVRWLNRRGVDAKLFDLDKDPLPRGDCLVMQSSLNQFIPNHEAILQKFFTSEHKMIVLAEAVESFLTSSNPLLRKLAEIGGNTSSGKCVYRFDRSGMNEIFSKYRADKVIEVHRDLVGIFYLDNGKQKTSIS